MFSLSKNNWSEAPLWVDAPIRSRRRIWSILFFLFRYYYVFLQHTYHMYPVHVGCNSLLFLSCTTIHTCQAVLRCLPYLNKTAIPNKDGQQGEPQHII